MSEIHDLARDKASKAREAIEPGFKKAGKKVTSTMRRYGPVICIVIALLIAGWIGGDIIGN